MRKVVHEVPSRGWAGQKLVGANYQPKLRKIITTHLDGPNAGGLVLPDGSGRPLRLRPGPPSELQIALLVQDTFKEVNMR